MACECWQHMDVRTARPDCRGFQKMPQAPAGQSSSDPPKRTFWLLFRPLKSHSYSQGLASKKAMDGTPKQNESAER